MAKIEKIKAEEFQAVVPSDDVKITQQRFCVRDNATAHPKNPRVNIASKLLALIASFIAYGGQNLAFRPLLYLQADGSARILQGHRRIAALKQLFADNPALAEKMFPGGTMLCDIIAAGSLTPEQELRYLQDHFMPVAQKLSFWEGCNIVWEYQQAGKTDAEIKRLLNTVSIVDRAGNFGLFPQWALDIVRKRVEDQTVDNWDNVITSSQMLKIYDPIKRVKEAFKAAGKTYTQTDLDGLPEEQEFKVLFQAWQDGKLDDPEVRKPTIANLQALAKPLKAIVKDTCPELVGVVEVLLNDHTLADCRQILPASFKQVVDHVKRLESELESARKALADSEGIIAERDETIKALKSGANVKTPAGSNRKGR